MKNIKNSIKKLTESFNFREQNQPVQNESRQDLKISLETKSLNYRDSIAGIVSYKGYEFPGDAVHKRVLENIEDLDIREDDIFLISYPANGGHLLEDMIQSLVSKHVEKTIIKEMMETKKDDEEEVDNNEEVPKINITIARLEASNLYGHIRWLKSLKSPRIISTSLPYDLLPQQLQTPTAKLIYMGRNCKDHIVAYYYHHRLKGIQIQLDDFVDLYLNGRLLYGNYLDHLVSYWQLSRLYQNNVMFICYEELKILTLKMAKLIAKFLNLSLTEDEINEIIADKQGKSTNAMNIDDLRQMQDSSFVENSPKLNKFYNVLGDWNHYLDESQVEKINAMIKLKLESQDLHLVDDPEIAFQNIQKTGRIMDFNKMNNNNNPDKNNRKSKFLLLDNLDKNSILMSLAPRNKSKFKKKLVLTKDEAKFIRKKDKVVIVYDNDAKDANGRERRKTWFQQVFEFFCCCFIPLFKRSDYHKI